MLWIDSIPGIDRRRLHGICLALAICAFFIVDTIDAATNESKDTWTGFSTSCTSEDSKNASVSCHGVRIVRKIVQQLLETTSKERDIQLFDGISLVEVPGSSRKARVLKGFGGLGPFLQFLEGRELRVKLPSLLPPNIETALKESLPSEAEARKEGGGFGGGGGGGGGFGGGKGGKKGGGGGLILMMLMMGKMMAAMGFGALGLLAMKALMVSAMALMLSLIVAVKKLAGGGDDHGGGHHVVYAQEVGHHHRKKRSVVDVDSTQLPYRGYAHLYANLGPS
ncbi:PREDICTED: uncharacterized protein LOC108781234 [Cyphomyrmex costatus]|uniref:Uncharacterized protein n=1 Tax=Cyphomyrmex costatus TaxID=456900 RepID=A0A195C0L2_9HYME|nr:PREDICTED: uncharacterized protein LOC108781234 [Cyphomyrmex costatus]KYM94434.1 hypothetical protein ALC62_14877 [Cyphomyrmex costatus]